MKPIQNKKLQLKKQAITNLTQTEQNAIRGGDGDEITTSWGKCTGALCCGGNTENCDVTIKILTIIITIL